MRRSLLVVVLGFGFPLTAAAQPSTETATEAPAPAAPIAPPTPPPVVFGWEALVDTYYLYNFTGESSTQAPGLRAFDTTANNVALGYAKLGMQAETELVAFRLDLGAGHAAAILNSVSRDASTASPPAARSDSEALYGNGFLVQQAFATIKPLSFLSISAGKFMSSASAELLEANKNWLYSRSLLFYGAPAFHTGLRFNLTLSQNLTVKAEICNGWNNDPDINANKTFGANATYEDLGLGLTAAATTYIGKEGGPDGDNTRMLFDGVVTKNLGKLSLGANADYLKHGDAYWFGIAGMGRFIINEQFNLAVRAEYLKSKNRGYVLVDSSIVDSSIVDSSIVDSSIYEVTAQGAWTMGRHYELRLEVRTDMSDKEIFAKGTAARKNQVTGLLAALAYF